VELTAEELVVSGGLSPLEAEELALQVNAYSSQSVQERWPIISRQLLRPDLPPAVHACVHRFVFRDWHADQGPAPAWFPTDALVQDTNIASLLVELQLDSYQHFYEWSIARRADFWDTMIRRLGIRFRTPYSQILDPQSSPQHPQWLVGARLNIADSCFQMAPNATAIRFSQPDNTIHEWTYDQLDEWSDRVAGGLQQSRLSVGDAVAIDMPMTAESVAIYLGIVKAGCVAVSIADSFAPSEIATRLRIGRAKVIFTQDYVNRGGKRLPLYERVCAAQGPRAVVIGCENAEPFKLRSGDIAWHDFLESAFRSASVERAPNDHTNYLFSSGTTGEPKMIPWNHVSPIKCAVDGFVHHDIQPRDVVAWPTNLGWMMGPWLIYASLINRATIALFHDAPTGRSFGQFVHDARVTVLGVVPSLVSKWKNTGCMAGFSWSTIKCFSSAGECSNADDNLWLMAQAGYKPVIEYCGGTELAGGYAAGTLVQPQVPTAFSTPTVGTELVVLDEFGQPAKNGELYLVPPAIGMSTELINRDHDEVYYADTPLNPQGQPLRRHGDQVEAFAGGYFGVHGRTDDTMNLGGIKVSSAEIERALSFLEDLLETAAIAISPPGGGPSRLVIFAVPALGRHLRPAELQPRLQKIIHRDLNSLFHVYKVVVVDHLPRTASNKIMRRELRAKYAE
jgi:acetyl-CoA synthetase